MVTQTGCIGLCSQEPVARVILDGQETVYVNLTPEKARRIVAEHLKGGKPVGIRHWPIRRRQDVQKQCNGVRRYRLHLLRQRRHRPCL